MFYCDKVTGFFIQKKKTGPNTLDTAFCRIIFKS